MSLQAAWEVLFWFREVHSGLGLSLHLADVRATLADDDAGGNIGDEELDDDFGWVYHDVVCMCAWLIRPRKGESYLKGWESLDDDLMVGGVEDEW